MRIHFLALSGAFLLVSACSPAPFSSAAPEQTSVTVGGSPKLVGSASGEVHFAALKQITFAGENAEAYFSDDGEWITFQATHGDHPCDQQWVMRTDGTGLKRISDGRGKTTCGWFFPGSKKLLFASSGAHDAFVP